MSDLGGQTLGRYQLLDRLGRGGMADVYRAYQPGLDRYVAIKVLHPHLSEETDFITRFQREARSVAALRHPNIVQVFDFDVQDGRYFMVMEYIEGGKTLKELLQELSARGERLPVRTVLAIAVRLADALDYAHQRGMIHRDIKPSNILVPDLGHPVLSDFGIARLVGQTGLTASGAMIGTPAYMSPEQGRGEAADERSDIYALGIVIYEMLTGRPPYDADTPYGVILKHINDPLIPPRMLIGQLPESVERVVLRSLAKSAADRYPSAGELHRALQDALDRLDQETQVSASTPAPGMPSPRSLPTEPGALSAGDEQTVPIAETPSTAAVTPRRRRWWLWAVVGVVAFLVCGFLALAILSGSDEGEKTAAGEEPPGGSNASPAAEGDVGALLEQAFAEAENDNPEAAARLFEQVLEQDPQNVAALLGLGYIVWEDDPDAAAALFEQARASDPDNPWVALAMGTLHTYADSYYDQDAALAEFTRAIEGCGEDASLCSGAYYERARIYAWGLGDYEAAMADISAAIEIEPDPYKRAERMIERADILLDGLGDPDSALAEIEAAYDMYPEATWYLENGAARALYLGRHEHALRFLSRLQEDHPDELARFLAEQAVVLRAAGDPAGAEAALARALEVDPDEVGAHYLRGLILLDDAGDPAGALAEFAQVEARLDDWDTLWRYNSILGYPFGSHELFYDMARASRAAGDLDAALARVAQSIDRNAGWPQPFILRAEMLAEQGEWDGARESYLRALEETDDPDLEAAIHEALAQLGD